MKLPPDPSGLPPEWTPDPTHQDPNGSRWRHPSGDYLDFKKGRPGLPGWRGKDHWHHNGGEKHLKLGTDIPDPAPSCKDQNQSDPAADEDGDNGGPPPDTLFDMPDWIPLPIFPFPGVPLPEPFPVPYPVGAY